MKGKGKPINKSAEKRLSAALESTDKQVPFGPLFFLQQLAAFVRDRCPAPEEGLPVVSLHLLDGEVLDVCHIIGVSPRWLALATFDTEKASDKPPMRTELIPYSIIARVRIGSSRHDWPHIGFNVGHEPDVLRALAPRAGMSPEETLRMLSRPAPVTGRKSS